MRLLYVEDDLYVRKAFTRCLRRHDDIFRFQAAKDGQEALSLLGSNVFDAVITDFHMPHGRLPYIQKVRRQFPELCLVVLSGMGYTDQKSCELAGVDRVIMKGGTPAATVLAEVYQMACAKQKKS